MRALKIIAISLTGLLLSFVLFGLYALGGDEVPASGSYRVDLARLRSLARSIEGPLPVAVHSELVAEAAMPRAVMMAGESFDPQPMHHVVYQVRYPDGRFVMIDSAMDEATMAGMGPGERSFHADAYERVLEAMTRAWQIVITHEHADHIGGIAKHPSPELLIGRVKLNRAQLENDYWLAEVGFPESLRERLEPLDYEGTTAIAPGIVLQDAEGHTKGSQMIFVTLQDGRELLFVGDVAWCREALRDRKYRPRATTWMLGEQRQLVLDQFRALHDLFSNERVRLVVSHEPGDRAPAGIIEGF